MIFPESLSKVTNFLRQANSNQFLKEYFDKKRESIKIIQKELEIFKEKSRKIYRSMSSKNIKRKS